MSENINSSAMLLVGTVLHGTYRIDGYLSSGGFGNTYVATNIQFDERYAIKEFFMKGVTQRDGNNTTVSVSNSENANSFAEQLEKFKKEARRLRKLKSEHIVRVYDLFEENGTAYYVMDFIQGENLAERLKRTREPLQEAEALGIVDQVLDALGTAHNQGIWHLDLKPANIMVDASGTAKLIDFGASKQQSTKGGATTSTAVSYTNGYAPREQMEQNLDKFGPWTDLYALGATLYTLLTNQKPPLPSDIDDDRSADKHLALPMPQEISQKTRRLVLWLMATSRLDRPQKVSEVVDYLNKPAIPVADDVTVTLDKPRSDDTIRVKPATVPPPAPKLSPEPPKPEAPTPEPQPKPQPKPRPVSELQPHSSISGDVGKRNASRPSWLKPIGAIAILAVVVAVLAVAVSAILHPKNDEPVAVAPAKKAVNTVTDMPLDTTVVKFGMGRYTGPVSDGNVPNGRGEAWFDNGSYYKGQFINGVMQGDSCYFRFSNGDVYEGSFVGYMFSKGKITLAQDGSYFEGTFRDGQPDRGIWYDKNGKKLP